MQRGQLGLLNRLNDSNRDRGDILRSDHVIDMKMEDELIASRVSI